MDDTCDSPNQEGCFQRDQGLVCKIDEIKYSLFTPNTWYGDSCASYTINNDELGLFDSKEIAETITGIEGQSVASAKVGKKRMLFLQANEKITDRILGTVTIFPQSYRMAHIHHQCDVKQDQIVI